MNAELQNVLSSLGAAMGAPDADVNFLQRIQAIIAAKMHSGSLMGSGDPGQAPGGLSATQAAGAMPPGITQPGGMASPMSGSVAPMTNSPMAGQGVMPAPSIPNIDELRRVLASGAGAR